MECPYGFELWADEWAEVLKRAEVNRYPVRLPAILPRLRRFFSVPDGAELIPGNGSDELIQMLLILRGCANLKVLSPTPSFVMYERITRLLGGEFVGFPLDRNDNFGPDPSKFEEAVRKHRPNVIFLSLPNNPTGNMFPPELAEIAAASGALTVADCAYRFFDEPPRLPDMHKFPNLVVIWTLSKIGMAGLRFGFAAAQPEVAEQLRKIRLPYNIGVLTEASLDFVTEADRMQTIIRRASEIRQERERMLAEMRQLPGIRPYPSATNFILFEVLSRPTADLHRDLLGHKILLKNLTGTDPALKGCLRVSMGTPTENRIFLDTLKTLL